MSYSNDKQDDMSVIAVYDNAGVVKGDLIYKNSKGAAKRVKQKLVKEISFNNSVVEYRINEDFTKEEILLCIPKQYIGRSGLAKKCQKCGKFFVSNNQHKFWCDGCYNNTHQNVTCPVCGGQFIQKYQKETYCCRSCKAKALGNFKNPIILKKIAETNKKRHGFENPFDNPEIQKKCQKNNDRTQQKLKLKKINDEKYKENRRLKSLKSGACQVSHKEMVLIDTLQKIYKIKSQYTFEDCVFKNKMRFDIFRPCQSVVVGGAQIQVQDLLIEYDGEQHYSPIRFNNISDSQMYANFISTQVKDWFKDKYCIEKNIPLIRISPTAMANPTFDDIYKNALIVGKKQASDQRFKCFGIIPQDFVNTSSCTFTIESGISCTFKCNKESHCNICQNFALNKQEPIETTVNRLIDLYISQDLSHSITFQGLEPLDNLKQLLWFIYYFRQIREDPIYIWTGYEKDECEDLIYLIKEKMHWENIIIKFGRFKPNEPHHIDPILGVELASTNQYAEKIS